jgi:hypothetical protein
VRLLKPSDLVAVIAFVITAVEFTYWLGQRSRRALDAANDALSSLWTIAMGVGEDCHYSALGEVLDMVAAILASDKAVKAFPVMVVAAPPAPPAPSAPPEPRTPRPARRRRSSAKTQD